jgi:hypothetical protein
MPAGRLFTIIKGEPIIPTSDVVNYPLLPTPVIKGTHHKTI